jgi:hypothetical protein
MTWRPNPLPRKPDCPSCGGWSFYINAKGQMVRCWTCHVPSVGFRPMRWS